MTVTRTRIRGESYLTLETVAECYQCEVSWVRAVYAEGLLGPGVVRSGRVLVRSAVLDRVATVYRLSVHQGVPLETVSVLLGPEPR